VERGKQFSDMFGRAWRELGMKKEIKPQRKKKGGGRIPWSGRPNASSWRNEKVAEHREEKKDEK